MCSNRVASLALVLFVCCAATAGKSLKQIMHEHYTKRGTAHHKSLPTKRQDHKETEADAEMCFTIPHLEALQEQFSNLDVNRDGTAEFNEVYNYLKNYNPAVSKQKVRDFIARRDTNGDGAIQFIPEYLTDVTSPDNDIRAAREWFTLEDTDSDGYVSRDELINIATNVGMSKEEAEATVVGYYMSADQNGDDRLSWEEYLPLYAA